MAPIFYEDKFVQVSSTMVKSENEIEEMGKFSVDLGSNIEDVESGSEEGESEIKPSALVKERLDRIGGIYPPARMGYRKLVRLAEKYPYLYEFNGWAVIRNDGPLSIVIRWRKGLLSGKSFVN